MIQNTEKNFSLIKNSNGLQFDRLKKINSNIERVFLKQGILLAIVGFLLGRAVILSQVTPFALPFFAAVFMMKRNKQGLVLLFLLLGAASQDIFIVPFVLGAVILFKLFHLLGKKANVDDLKKIVFSVFVASLCTRVILLYFQKGLLTHYDVMMTIIEGGLSLVLTLVFIQGVPLVSSRKRNVALKNEEIICLIILLASILTGTIGWSVYNISIEHIFSRYLVISLAFVGGAAIGSTVGVVTGLILSLANVTSLYQMSLLAFAGLMGGLLKEGKKLGVAFGLIIGTLLIGLYGEGNNDLVPTVMESIIALVIFFLTPKKAFSTIAKYIPGTEEHAKEQQQYVKKVRDITANRVEQFSSLFQVLSTSFSNNYNNEEADDFREVDYFLSNVTEKTCQSCFKKSKCWEKNFNKTYAYMLKIMQEVENNSKNANYVLEKEWEKHCNKSDKVFDTVRRELSFYQANQKLKRQVQESRKLVADQLLGVSEVMKDFAIEIQKERENHHYQEEQILDALTNMGLEISNVEIYSLKEGNVDIELSIPYSYGRGECEKLIAPMLSDILGETIEVKKEELSHPNGYSHVSLGSTKTFVVEAGVTHTAKGGAWVSGDSYATMEIGAGKYALAISDGMGNGERAHIESKETLKLLQQILQSGIEEKVAIKSVNSVLSLRTTDEIFSTLDLAIIDLQEATAKFLKIGSAPSFIKRGDKVIKVEAGNLPMGIIQDFEVDVVNEQLKAGDLLIMMSDGIFEGPKHVENYDVWMKRKIRELQTTDPQEVSDLLLEEVIRTRDGLIEDDMTVVTAKIEHNTPKWAAIPVYTKKAQ